MENELCREHSDRLSRIETKIDTFIDNNSKQYNKLLNAVIKGNESNRSTIQTSLFGVAKWVGAVITAMLGIKLI